MDEDFADWDERFRRWVRTSFFGRLQEAARLGTDLVVSYEEWFDMVTVDPEMWLYILYTPTVSRMLVCGVGVRIDYGKEAPR